MRHSSTLFVPCLTHPSFQFINAVRLLQIEQSDLRPRITVNRQSRYPVTCESFPSVDVHDPVIIKTADDSGAAMVNGSYARACSAPAEIAKDPSFQTADHSKLHLLLKCIFI